MSISISVPIIQMIRTATITQPIRQISYNDIVATIPANTLLDLIPDDIWTSVAMYFNMPSHLYVVGRTGANYPGYRPVNISDGLGDFVRSVENGEMYSLCDTTESGTLGIDGGSSRNTIISYGTMDTFHVQKFYVFDWRSEEHKKRYYDNNMSLLFTGCTPVQGALNLSYILRFDEDAPPRYCLFRRI